MITVRPSPRTYAAISWPSKRGKGRLVGALPTYPFHGFGRTGISVLRELRPMQIKDFPYVCCFDLALAMPEMVGEHRDKRVIGKALPLLFRCFRPQFTR